MNATGPDSVHPIEKTFHFKGREYWRQFWLGAITFQILGIGVGWMGKAAGMKGMFLLYKVFLSFIAVYLLALGAACLCLASMRSASVKRDGLTLWSGIPGFRKRFHIPWDAIEFAEITILKKSIVRGGPYGAFRNLIEREGILLKIKGSLDPVDRGRMIKWINQRLDVNSICTNDERTEVFIVHPPREGYELLLEAIGQFVTIKKTTVPMPSDTARFLWLAWDSILTAGTIMVVSYSLGHLNTWW